MCWLLLSFCMIELLKKAASRKEDLLCLGFQRAHYVQLAHFLGQNIKAVEARDGGVSSPHASQETEKRKQLGSSSPFKGTAH